MYRFPSGAEYNGTFYNGKMQGEGLIVFADKSQYSGEFQNNKYHGKGTEVMVNGERY